MKSRYLLPFGATLCSLFTVVNPLHAQVTGFTYQGRLTDNGGPANGNYDLQFYLRDAATAGNPIGTTNTVAPVAVSNGLFTVTLDFGANFPGADRWLEIAVRTNGGGAFSTLAPRQPITPTPYAITAGTAASLAIPTGMALIPAGAFTMGDTLDGLSDAVPISVNVSAFYMDVNLVSLSQWQSVYYWATNHGYNFVNAGLGKAPNHPVETVDWWDCVKWCNARSEQAGKTPVYYTDAGLTAVYKTGEVAVRANWVANGYRLPTEAEWEKAARGGLSGQRFPWGNVINENLANYIGDTTFAYDLGPNGYNAIGLLGGSPFTSPVGSFAANGYGLNDMAGNVHEWCWDWYAGPAYPAGSPYLGGIDPHGPAGPLSVRLLRGGSRGYIAYVARCAFRFFYSPTIAVSDVGFRCVRGL